MKKTWQIGLPLAVVTITLYGCGRKEKSDRTGDEAPAADGGSDGTTTNDGTAPPKKGPLSADAILNDGSMVALRDGDTYFAMLLAAAQIKRSDLGDVNAQGDLIRLKDLLPRSGAGPWTFTNSHIINASKLAFSVCDAWVKKAAQGGDARFAQGLPWTDGGAADKYLVQSSLAPVFQAAFWGPNAAEQPGAVDVNAALFPFNESLAVEAKNPANGQTVAPLNFANSAIANCITFAVSSPSWFL